MSQTATIAGWHPTTSPNSQRRHWRDVQHRHHVDRDTAWASARQAGWTYVEGKVRLTIVLVYPRKYRWDADNLVARCKGIIDGLKRREAWLGTTSSGNGWFADDDTTHLELVVRAEVEPGRKETRLLLEEVLP